MKDHLRDSFAKGFTEECEKIAVLPALGALVPAAVGAAKTIGTGVAIDQGSKALGGLMKKRKSEVPTV